ncbi:MAG: Crp/Fnr family transcriptional regulator [Rhodocyclaceae bacterium]|nr:Crp/Fnr family transcriptional regulator [Rhodocyclaceae bacterium]
MAIHVNFLSRIPLLASLPLPCREQLAARMRRVEVARRAVLLEKGRRGQGMGFVLGGLLQGVDFTRDGREAGLYFVGTGDCFGELAVLDGGDSPEYVIALVKSEILWLDESDARALLLPSASVVEALARKLAARVRSAIRQRSLLAMPNPMQRLAALLVEMADDGKTIMPTPTHQELAIMINTTRETVSRAFQSFFAAALVSRDGERLLLRDVQALQRLASEGELPLAAPSSAGDSPAIKRNS